MDILSKILSDDNLELSYKNVHTNEGAPGIDGMTTYELKSYFRIHGSEIKEQIRTRTYKPFPVKRVNIPKPDGGVRHLGIPTVTDRLIQQAIAQVLSPIFDKDFSEFSYGFRPNKSAHMAVDKALEYINMEYDWVVDIDLEKFFDKVHHDKLMRIISKTVSDGDVISLIRKYLVSGISIDGEISPSEIGTPQGGPLSPLLSNIMLNELDKELEKRGHKFVRYADDCLIFVRSEKSANRVMKRITRFIEEELSLSVNVTKSRVTKPENIKFLGFGFYKNHYTNEYKQKVHEISLNKFKEKIKLTTKRNWGVSLTYRLLKLQQQFQGWFNYFGKYIGISELKKIDNNTRFRLRMIIWKRWKNTKTRFKALIKLGVNKYKAWEWANSRRSYARVATSFIMTRTVTNNKLTKRGFLSLESLKLKTI
ncbi:MAG TPA: group II intron reverse transcriptase/maturase [Bacilli bacterium]|mgnify:FL=1|nr:group II intron reverse transcriptase/maturase [Bacilli bacterium]